MPASAKERQWQKNAGNREALREGKELGEIPKCANPKRRRACEADTPTWLKTYLPGLFWLDWSPDHLKVIARVDQVVDGLAQFALGMPRASGKTQIAIGCTLKAILTGRRRYVVLFAATFRKAKKLIADLREAILSERNDSLLADYPEYVVPMRAVNCDSRKTKDQTFNGQPTKIACGPTLIDFGAVPRLAGAKGFHREPFALIEAMSISSTEIRGTHQTKDGEAIRPDMVLLDDVQTDKVSVNPLRVEELLETIEGSVLGMAGPKSKISALACCTVRVPGDANDRLLNRQICPAWQGERYKMLYSFPERMDLWREYLAIYVEHLQQDGNGSRATEFYRERQAEMDRGAAVAWPERFEPGEISGIQRAMNLFLLKPRQFASEYQNSPLDVETEGTQLDEALLKSRIVKRKAGVVPVWANKLTCGVDVQDSLLFWVVTAWRDDFTGHVVDYGTWPGQKGRRHFALSDVLFTLQSELKGAAIEAQIRNGLKKLTDELMGRQWGRDGGESFVQLDRMFIDMGHKQDVVIEHCRVSPCSAQIRANKGRGISAKQTQWGDFPKRDGERLGYHWLEKILRGSTLRTTQHDTNFWKTFVKDRFLQGVGERGGLTLCADEVSEHATFIRHLTAEFGQVVKVEDVQVEEWTERPNRDNHWWDALILSTVAASFEGIRFAHGQTERRPAAQRINIAEMQRQARAKAK